jgi:hypothetical protein
MPAVLGFIVGNRNFFPDRLLAQMQSKALQALSLREIEENTVKQGNLPW